MRAHNQLQLSREVNVMQIKNGCFISFQKIEADVTNYDCLRSTKNHLGLNIQFNTCFGKVRLQLGYIFGLVAAV